MAIEVLPADLLKKGKHEEGLIFIQKLPVPDNVKKRTFAQYNTYHGAIFDREYVRKVLGFIPEWMDI